MKVFAERQSEQLPNFARERALNLYCTLLRAEKCNLVAFDILALAGRQSRQRLRLPISV
jgi:hypothetical protein